jgi:hypothetical protein
VAVGEMNPIVNTYRPTPSSLVPGVRGLLSPVGLVWVLGLPMVAGGTGNAGNSTDESGVSPDFKTWGKLQGAEHRSVQGCLGAVQVDGGGQTPELCVLGSLTGPGAPLNSGLPGRKVSVWTGTQERVGRRTGQITAA